MKQRLSPTENVERTKENSVLKAGMSTTRLMSAGIIAGMAIGIGAVSSTIMIANTSSLAAGLRIFLGAFIFTIGILMVVLAGAELFTGNVLMVMGVWSRRISLRAMCRNWVIVYLFNFIGALLVVFLVSRTRMLQPEVGAQFQAVAKAKLSYSLGQVFLKAVGCNFLVCVAIFLASSAEDSLGKIVGCSFPVMIFIIMGFEHSVANMTYLPLAKVLGADITWKAVLMKNLLPVTLGNILGGMILAFLYEAAYGKGVLDARKVM